MSVADITAIVLGVVIIAIMAVIMVALDRSDNKHE